MSVNEAIDAYLTEAASEMGGSFWEQQTVRDELRAHIRDLAHEYEVSGMDGVAATRTAMRDLGHPADVGAALRMSRGRKALQNAHLHRQGAIRLERRPVRHLPPALLVLGAGALAATTAAIAIAYAWP